MPEIPLVDRLRIVWTSCNDRINAERAEAADEIERLRKERDEARRRVCEDAIAFGSVYRRIGATTVRLNTPREVAAMMGWDCYGEASP